eukprot:TRINITY_DN1343_c1_g1_i1.p1 TRINITY_DN1343_c1_g1~~TRINITY_DN1343_c1_g1_i1.p1  ORF type:complete len:396 (+),score=141.33 TRINITY_DN1343_c1_g1_i1:217-1404(+)
MSLLTLAGLGVTGVSALSGAIGTPTLTTVALSTAGPLVLRWALTRYIKNSLGNYYYVYELVTGSTPDHRAGLVSRGLVATAAAGAASLAATAATIGVSMLVVTACGTGTLAYRIVEAGVSGTGAVLRGGVGATKAVLGGGGGGGVGSTEGLEGDDGMLVLELHEASHWTTVDVEPERAVLERLAASLHAVSCGAPPDAEGGNGRAEGGDGAAHSLREALAPYRAWHLLERGGEALEEDWQVVGDDFVSSRPAPAHSLPAHVDVHADEPSPLEQNEEGKECGPGSPCAASLSASLYGSLYEVGGGVSDEAVAAQEALHCSRSLRFECGEGDEIVEDCEVSLSASVSAGRSLAASAPVPAPAAATAAPSAADLAASMALSPSEALAASDDDEEEEDE